jgi:3-oxoacyl-[acyl-carrier-protein] synthase I
MKKQRVVITGVGVVAPNGVGKSRFEHAIKKGISGIKHIPELRKLNFSCQIAGIPEIGNNVILQYFDELTLKTLKSTGIQYGVIAAVDAWKDAGLSISTENADEDSGCIFGTGLTGGDAIRDAIYHVDSGQVRRLGSRLVEQTMSSGISAFIGGKLGLGNQVSSNSSACSTGAEAIYMGYERIVLGKAKRMLVGSCDSQGPYIWGGFDAMRVLNRTSNDNPEKGSCPLSQHAAGFIPGAGAGAMVLETLESALERGATIYAELGGGAVTSGGQRNGGTMTAPNPEGVQRCIKLALEDAKISADEIDAISGHLTSTMGDVLEIKNWQKVLNRTPDTFPYINATKSLIGHCLGAAGAIESVAVALQLKNNFFHPSLNSLPLHNEIEPIVCSKKIPMNIIENSGFNIIAKTSFGFGDVNCCLIFKKYF